jgi:TIR domain-containing protein/HEAT repeat protein
MPWRVFYSYSHRDSELRERLATYLAPLRQQKKIVEWHDRKIQPGADWDNEISGQLDSAHLILLLVSEDFLASEYCFGVEVERALARLKSGEASVVPILLKPCLWQESRFSELQIIPRNAKAITSFASREEAFVDVANEIRKLVSEPPPSLTQPSPEPDETHRFDASLGLVRGQVQSYARLYERTRQRMRASRDRTARMEQIFVQMCALATASYPLLDELANSPSPGDRLAAVAILHVFASEQSLPFLVRLVGSEKPFVGYHAITALRFAVSALDARFHPQLLEALQMAQDALKSANVGFDTDRQTVLRKAEQELQAIIESLAAPGARHD